MECERIIPSYGKVDIIYMFSPSTSRYWVPRDIERVILEGQSPYDYSDYCKFFRKVWGLDNFGQDRVELWQRNIRFDLLYWHNGQLICTVFLKKAIMSFPDGRTFPFSSTDDWMEFESLCLCMIDTLSCKPKPSKCDK